MTKKSIIVITALFLICGFFFIQNITLTNKLNEAQQLEEINKINQDMKDMQSYLASKVASSNIARNYESWLTSTEIAEQLYTDSDGKFQKEWGLFLGELAQQHDIDPYIVYELLKTETGGTFDPTIVGPETRYGQAYGLAQFMKNTAPWIAEMAHLPYSDELLFDPLYSIQLSVTYLDYLYDEYKDWDYALTAYHRGVGGLNTYVGNNGHAKSQYAVDIQKGAEEFDLVAYSE